LVAVQLLGGRGVDDDLDLAIKADRDFAFEHDLRLLTASAPPGHDRTPSAPLGETGGPIVVRGEPPGAIAIHPIPTAHGIPARGMVFAHDLVLDHGAGDGSAEVIANVDGRGDFVAELDGLGRSDDFDLEFGLLVFLDAEVRAAVMANDLVAFELDELEAIDAEARAFGQGIFAGDAAELVRGVELFEDLFALGIEQAKGESLA